MRIKCAVVAAFATLMCCLLPASAGAVTIGDPPVEAYSPVFVTALQVTDKLEFIELHNNADEPVNLAGWKIELSTALAPVCEIPLESWLLADDYVVASQNAAIEAADVRQYEPCEPAGSIVKIALYQGAKLQEALTPPAGSAAYVRKNTTKTYRSGDFAKDFYSMSDERARKTLYAGRWYEPPQNTHVQINEVLANTRNCSPTDTAGDCGDFVELYNPTNQPIDLSQFRLRNGYQGQSPSASNTYRLAGNLQPGQLAAITHDADGRALSITNGGGFVWLEDTYGVKRYDNTIQEYADADGKKGQSWAYDHSDGTWKWGVPSPALFNQFPIAKVKTPETSSLSPCKPGQYRSEETNRCRNIATSASTLVPCKPSQYRSEETNRCRNIASAANQLTPCQPGQERNPQTNRCRKKAASNVPESAFAVEPIKETGKAFAGWWVLGGLGTLAVGRGMWEWRSEMLAGIRKVGSFFTSGK